MRRLPCRKAVALLLVAGLVMSSGVLGLADTDGIDVETELVAGTDPFDPDTDGDGVADDRERTLETDPTAVDTDDDGLADGREVALGTDPALTDTDADGLADAKEVVDSTDPREADTDADGLDDRRERRHGTDPTVADTDGDGLEDGIEVERYGSDPLATATVENGLTDAEQADYGLDPTTDPTIAELETSVGRLHLDKPYERAIFDGPDADGDGFADRMEANTPTLDPTRKDVVVRAVWTRENAPPAATLLRLQRAYAQAPVDDGTGIRLHVWVDRRIDASQSVSGQALREDVYAERTGSATGMHYGLFTDAVTIDGTRTAGVARQELPVFAVGRETDRFVGKTTMHELGHSLGLLPHGFDGIDSRTYEYQNYPSVMNYNAEERCHAEPTACYDYSSGRGHADWRAIERQLEAGTSVS